MEAEELFSDVVNHQIQSYFEAVDESIHLRLGSGKQCLEPLHTWIPNIRVHSSLCFCCYLPHLQPLTPSRISLPS